MENGVKDRAQADTLPAMTDLQIQCFNLDSNDPQRAAAFWQEALGCAGP